MEAFLSGNGVAAAPAALVSHAVAGYNGLLSSAAARSSVATGKESVPPDRKLTVKFIPERLRVPNPREEQNSESVDPGRVLLILLRLGERYYDVAPASDRIASCVWAELTDSEEHPSVLS